MWHNDVNGNNDRYKHTHTSHTYTCAFTVHTQFRPLVDCVKRHDKNLYQHRKTIYTNALHLRCDKTHTVADTMECRDALNNVTKWMRQFGNKVEWKMTIPFHRNDFIIFMCFYILFLWLLPILLLPYIQSLSLSRSCHSRWTTCIRYDFHIWFYRWQSQWVYSYWYWHTVIVIFFCPPSVAATSSIESVEFIGFCHSIRSIFIFLLCSLLHIFTIARCSSLNVCHRCDSQLEENVTLWHFLFTSPMRTECDTGNWNYLLE